MWILLYATVVPVDVRLCFSLVDSDVKNCVTIHVANTILAIFSSHGLKDLTPRPLVYGPLFQ